MNPELLTTVVGVRDAELLTKYNLRCDAYATVLFRPNTAVGLAKMLIDHKCIFIGMTDEESTHIDLFLAYGVEGIGYHQRGLRNHDLFVMVMGYKGFAFAIHGVSDYTYYAEKLGYSHYGESVTIKKIADLLNGIRIELEQAQP